MPESFWDVCCRVGVLRYMDKTDPDFLDWNGRISAGRGGAFKQAVGDVIRRVLRVSMVIDPVRRANAQDIVEMMPDAWEAMEAFSVDELETIMTQAAESCNDDETIEDSSFDGGEDIHLSQR